MNESETDWLHFPQHAYLKQTHIHTHTYTLPQRTFIPSQGRERGLGHMFWKIIKLECFPTQQSFRAHFLLSFLPDILPK